MSTEPSGEKTISGVKGGNEYESCQSSLGNDAHRLLCDEGIGNKETGRNRGVCFAGKGVGV